MIVHLRTLKALDRRPCTVRDLSDYVCVEAGDLVRLVEWLELAALATCRDGRLQLTRRGTQRLVTLLETELSELDPDAVSQVLRGFDHLDVELLHLTEENDTVLTTEHLRLFNAQCQPWLAELGRTLGRLGSYDSRLTRALEKRDHAADAYLAAWAELRADLIDIADRNRLRRRRHPTGEDLDTHV
jgi:hypothetical protein